MPADLVAHEMIPDLSRKLTPELTEELRVIQKEGFVINNDSISHERIAALAKLAELGLLDTGYEGDTNGRPSMWIINGNGTRALNYRTGIRGGPHYEIASSELASWLEDQGKDQWWNVDGDPLLTGRMAFPCRAEQLAQELRLINRPLLIQAKKTDSEAHGQAIRKEDLNALVSRFAENQQYLQDHAAWRWGTDRFFYLCWKHKIHEWLITEDSETATLMSQDRTEGIETAKVSGS